MLDTERPAKLVFQRAGDELGYPISDDLYFSTLGRNNADTEAIIVSAFGSSFSYADLRARYLALSEIHVMEHGVDTKPGLIDLLDLLDSHGVRKAVATSTRRERAIPRLEIAGVLDRFLHIVTGDEVARGKPEPDIFLKAAAKLEAHPSTCVVLEDTDAGIRAAHAAGMKPIMVPDLQPPSGDMSRLAHKIFPSLCEVREYLDACLSSASR